MLQALLTLLGIFVGVFISLIINFFDRKDKFRLAAIEKRLYAHQEAYKLWNETMNVIHAKDNDENKKEILKRAQTFWFSNSLYLEKNTRDLFKLLLDIAPGYSLRLERLQAPKNKQKIEAEIEADWNKVSNDLPRYIHEEVLLEPIVVDLKLSWNGKNNQ